MKKPALKASTLLLAIFTAACGIQTDNEAPKRYSIAEFMDVVQLAGGSFSPDETKILISTKETGIFNAFEIDLNTGEKNQLTSSTDDAIFAKSYFPGDDRFIYTSDKGGNEITHVYVHDPDGSTRDLIGDSTAKAAFAGWSHDRKKLYMLSNSRDKRFFDLMSVQIEPGKEEGNLYPATMEYQNTEGLNPEAISKDGRYIALSKTITTNNSEMYLLDTQSKKIRHLSAHEGNVQFQPLYFSLDGNRLFYLTDEGSEYTYISSYDLNSGAKQKVEEAPWDIMYAYQSHYGKYRVVAINNDARTEIKIYNQEKNDEAPMTIDGLPEGDITNVNISDSEKLMSFFVTDSKSPENLFVYNFETQEVKQLTNTMSKSVDRNDLVAGEVIRYKSFDGLEIPALLYKPKGLKEGEKAPALLWIHGGPGGQTRLNYSPTIQHLVNHGYAILAVNNRGSSGYGKTFFAADDRKHGEDDLKDCIESKNFLATLPYIDQEKIGIVGGSYGGYMVMAALAFAPEEFNVGVNIFGVTNWLRTLKSIPPWWASFREALYAELGDPVKDSVMLYNKSPLFHADKITKPFIVLQGSNDPRVLKVESDEIVAAAKGNGIPVEYVIFPDEGHGFLKKANNIKTSQEILKFLDIHLKGLSEEEAGEQPDVALVE